MKHNEFDDEIKYRLFRSVQEILHPSISKKNISDYKIIIDEDILPVRIFYPKKVSDLSRVMIFIHGNAKVTDCMESYSDICKEITKNTNSLVIAIEYEEEQDHYKDMIEDIYKTVKYLCERLVKDGIDKKNIILAGDSTGGNIITSLNEKESLVEKEILFYPTLCLNYEDPSSFESLTANHHFNFNLLKKLQEYFNFISKEKLTSPLQKKLEKIPKTLLFVGKVDLLKDEAVAYKELYKEDVLYKELPFSSHGFLKKMDKELEEEVFEEIKKFME